MLKHSALTNLSKVPIWEASRRAQTEVIMSACLAREVLVGCLSIK